MELAAQSLQRDTLLTRFLVTLARWKAFRMTLMGIAVILFGLAASNGVALAADPTGADTLKENPNAAVNFVWTLVAAFLVFFMQAGFALLEAGSVRAKSTVNVLTTLLTADAGTVRVAGQGNDFFTARQQTSGDVFS